MPEVFNKNEQQSPPSGAARLAIMQPYLFPYIGYLQLMAAVDTFVIYDDVAFINKGWINRNKILVGGKDNLFTVPLIGASQNRLIKDIEIDDSTKWRGKFLKTLEQSYKKAPQFQAVFPVVTEIIESEEKMIAGMIAKSLEKMANYLEIKTKIVSSSSIYQNENLKAQERILDICLKEKAQQYINPSGGIELYDKNHFAEQGISLNFIRSKPIVYPQFQNEFVPWLSVIDVLMFNTKEQVTEILNQYELI